MQGTQDSTRQITFLLLAILVAATAVYIFCKNPSLYKGREIPADESSCSTFVHGDGKMSVEQAVNNAANQVVPNAPNLPDAVKYAQSQFGTGLLASTDYVSACPDVRGGMLATINNYNLGGGG